jgi:hypothetical protein
MSQSSFDPFPAFDAAPYRSVVGAWAIAIILLAAGELFVTCHGGGLDRELSSAPVSQQRAAAEETLAW